MSNRVHTTTPSEAPVLTRTLDCKQGKIGLITLNHPSNLNALNLPILQQLLEALDAWETDDQVAAIVFHGAGERGFCAGGDVRALYRAIQHSGRQSPNEAERFFELEYRLVYRLYTYPKPIVCWAHGATMGGGMGLMCASRYRLVTPSLKLAMGEVRLGFFPDVGASRFLNRLPGSIGMFLGLTGAPLNISDSLRMGMTDFAVPEGGLDELLELLQQEAWTESVESNDCRLYDRLREYAVRYQLDLSESHLEAHEQFIGRVCRGDSIPAVVEEILSADFPSEWFRKAQQNLREACPVSAHLVFEQLHRALQLGLADLLRMEMDMAVQCSRHRDFLEGVRARLIDKDNEPHWTHASVDTVPSQWILTHLKSPWPEDQHPLADLGLDEVIA